VSNSGLRVVVTGSREWTDQKTISRAIAEVGNIRLLVHGACRGADLICSHEALLRGIEVFSAPADWKRLGPKAGLIRNAQMLDQYEPNLVLAFPTQNSTGTWDLVRKAQAKGIPVRIYKQEVAP
jgi:hypothetical protein